MVNTPSNQSANKNEPGFVDLFCKGQLSFIHTFFILPRFHEMLLFLENQEVALYSLYFLEEGRSISCILIRSPQNDQKEEEEILLSKVLVMWKIRLCEIIIRIYWKMRY